MRLPMFKDSSGTPSFTMTAAAFALGSVLVKFLLANLAIGTFHFGPPPDAGLVGLLLGVPFTSYVARRNEIGVSQAVLTARGGKEP